MKGSENMQLVEIHQFNYNHKYYKQLDHLC